MDFTNDWFVVKNIDSFIDSSRALVFNNFGEQEESNLDIEINKTDRDELDRVLSFEESKSIILSLLKKQKNKKTGGIRYLMNNDLFYSIIVSLNDRMISNILHGLVNKGLVETAYDSDVNDFIFWIKEQGEDNNVNE